MNMTMSIL